MEKVAKREFIALGILLVLFLVLLAPALQYARREKRDGVRRDEVAVFKTELEQYYNAHETYPLEFDASPHEYVVVDRDGDGATSWYIRAQLENAAAAKSDFDDELSRNYYYRIVSEENRTYYDVCGGGPGCDI